MKYLIIFSILLTLSFSSCLREKSKDVSKVDNYLLVTDSLIDFIQHQFDFTSENFYLLIDDSLRLDSLAQIINLNDTTGFYQILEQNLSDINEILIQTQREVYFTKDQLLALKNEFITNKISKSEYLEELLDVNEMILFLNERVDSNLYLMKEKYNILFYPFKDFISE